MFEECLLNSTDKFNTGNCVSASYDKPSLSGSQNALSSF